MQLRIEMPTGTSPDDVNRFLAERQLRLPVFFEKNTTIVLPFNQHSRQPALEFIDWLASR